MNTDKRRKQEELETRLAKEIAKNPDSGSFQKAYDEFHRYILENGVRDAPPEGCVYKKDLSLFDRICLGFIGEKKRVLDIGCGEGTLALACARRGNDVIGLDISTVLVQLANSKKGSLPIEFEVGDARDLQFPDQCFDVVICKDVIEHLPESSLDDHLREVGRVLRDGGVYMVYTPSRLLGDLSLGLHLKTYSIADLAPILRENELTVEPICHWLLLIGVRHRVSNRWLLSALIHYEKLLDRIKVARLLSIFGDAAYAIVPMVWLCAVKSPGLRAKKLS